MLTLQLCQTGLHSCSLLPVPASLADLDACAVATVRRLHRNRSPMLAPRQLQRRFVPRLMAWEHLAVCVLLRRIHLLGLLSVVSVLHLLLLVLKLCLLLLISCTRSNRVRSQTCTFAYTTHRDTTCWCCRSMYC